MKRIVSIIMICLILSPACFAETSSTDRFLSNLSETWDSFLDMASDFGKGVSSWAEESGVNEWLGNTASDVSAWTKEVGLTDWADSTLKELNTWFEESGISEWAAGTSQEIQTFIEQNRPAVEAWLAEAGQEVRKAWDTLVNADAHTEEELEAAYETVVKSLEEAAG